VALPGIGPATAAGIRAFALNLPGTYLETNVRTVFLHELYPEAEGVPDRELLPLVEACCPKDATNPADDPRTWYFALLDYGAWLKKNTPNPSRRSAGHVRQSRFEGSHRQKRAMLVRALLAHREAAGVDVQTLVDELTRQERDAGRQPVSADDVSTLLEELAEEGFCSVSEGLWSI
jgi:A/G-specific adenine glycosylase